MTRRVRLQLRRVVQVGVAEGAPVDPFHEQHTLLGCVLDDLGTDTGLRGRHRVAVLGVAVDGK